MVVQALMKDDYTKGKSNRSITTLIDSPRVRILQDRHNDEIEQDVVEFIWSRFGTSVHNMFENAAPEGKTVLSEERLFCDEKGWTISGAIDLQEIHEENGFATVTVSDYKVTSVWSVIYGKEEWVNQLNCYAWLVRKAKGLSVTKLRIIAILRDWQRRRAEESGDYPESPVHIVEIPLWDNDTQDEYMSKRIDLHQEAEYELLTDGVLPHCSDQERWKKDDTYAVKKKGNKRALKVFSNKKDADDYFLNSDQNLVIEERKGEATRCVQNWCRVAEFCDQHNQSS